jgi:hypothetical protein
VLIDDLLRRSREARHEAGELTPDLFADFNGIPLGVDKTEFYQHEQNWSNRMILCDSLQVMASLAEREGLRSKVQCIYFDPPYGIKFNSNFQWSTTSRAVTDGRAEHITREPEQVKAFRDTWRDGIHSYLTYLRDRLTAKETEHHKFSARFLLMEWEEIVDAWQIETWEAYRDVLRLGRKTKLPQKQQATLWSTFDRVRNELAVRTVVTRAEMFTRLAARIMSSAQPPFDFVVIDEAQDMAVAHMRFFAGIGGSRPNGLFFAGDIGQRIFQQPFSWKALGIDVRERTHSLGVNYRTSHQIRTQSDRLLGPESTDADGHVDDRSKTISLYNGPSPIVEVVETEDAETSLVSEWIAARVKEGVAPHEFGIFVRSDSQLSRARAAIERASLPYKVLDEHVETTSGFASVSTMLRTARSLVLLFSRSFVARNPNRCPRSRVTRRPPCRSIPY